MSELYSAEERIVELEIEACRSEEHEEQVSSGPQDPAGCDGQDRAEDDHRSQDEEDYLLRCKFHRRLFFSKS